MFSQINKSDYLRKKIKIFSIYFINMFVFCQLLIFFVLKISVYVIRCDLIQWLRYLIFLLKYFKIV